MSSPAARWTGLPLRTEQMAGTSSRYIVRLLRAVYYRSTVLGRKVYVRLGWVTDLTSWWPEGRWTPAAVIHDRLYAAGEVDGKRVTRHEADLVYREALLSLGVSRRMATLMYLGVRLGGWRAWRRSRRLERKEGT